MTEYQQQQREQAKNTIQRIIDACQEPSTFKIVAKATGLSVSGVTTTINRNPDYFKNLGLHSSLGSRPMRMFQALHSASTLTPKKALQVLYVNPYHQLAGMAEYMDEQLGHSYAWTKTHNVRPSNKSPRVYVAGGTLA